MSNPFKKGDKVVARDLHDGLHGPTGYVFTVGSVRNESLVVLDTPHSGPTPWHIDNLRAAIAGQDYDVPVTEVNQTNTGHLPDGSSVQKHSAGPIYPCVITLRDARLKGTTLFDYGLTSPRNRDHIWFSTLEAAHAVADIIKKDIAS